MSRKKDPKIIRAGDNVKIISPYFFDRCGYPMTLQDGRDHVVKHLRREIEEFVNKTGIASFDTSIQEAPTDASLLAKKIINAFAYTYVKKQGFGGNERKIYTTSASSYKDKIYKVVGVRHVKTGTYSPGRYYGWHDGDDWDPSFLSEERTHKILRLFIGEIEAKNVEKIYDPVK